MPVFRRDDRHLRCDRSCRVLRGHGDGVPAFGRVMALGEWEQFAGYSRMAQRKWAVADMERIPAADPVAARNRRFRLSCPAVSCIGVAVTGREPAQEMGQ